MKGSFLDELAGMLIRKYPDGMEDLRIVFPNRRTGLFFTRALASHISKPLWSPQIFSIEDFIYSFSSITKGEHLSLIIDLYEVFQKKLPTDETLDRFYFWGDMLLRDFDEVDKYLVHPDDIFTTIKNIKEIDARFHSFSDEQKLALTSFWKAAGDNPSKQKNRFLTFWNSLKPVYREYKKILKEKGYAYQGMIYRELVEKMGSGNFTWNEGEVIFAGFNALTLSEEKIIKWFVSEKKARIFWDLDSWYFDNPAHEAGYFLRKYYNDRDFRSFFPATLSKNFENAEKKIITYASSQYTGQVRIAGNIVNDIYKKSGNPDMDRTAIILPDENLLSNLLYSMPDDLGRINITMGYSLRNSAFYSLINHLLDLQASISSGRDTIWFNHRPVINLLNHPFLRNVGKNNEELVLFIQDKNIIHVPQNLLVNDDNLGHIFRKAEPDSLIDYLLEALIQTRSSIEDEDPELFLFEKEFAIVIYKFLNQLKNTFQIREMNISADLIKKVLRSHSRFEKIPFTGEPLEGLQIMGLLETRNLDFENVIILCMNEGSVPGTGGSNSFIPFNVRKAFGLPLPENQDAIYAYLFYRLLQRARNIHLIYNTEESNRRNAEPSRYIYQLKFESPHTIRSNILLSKASVTDKEPVVIKKNSYILGRLKEYIQGSSERDRYLTPSKLNMYLACPLSFCYKNIFDIEEKPEVTEDLDSAKFGLIMHKTMEELYKPYLGSEISEKDFKNIISKVDNSIRMAFSEYHGFGDQWKNYRFEGKNILGKEIVRKYAEKILDHDQKNTPFRIIGLEKPYSMSLPVEMNGKTENILIRGNIDRIDMWRESIRIIDYKSGRDTSSFKSIEGLFDRSDERRNKAVFQTFLYALLYAQNHPGNQYPITSGLFNFKELHDKNFDIRIKIKHRNPVPDEPLSDLRGMLDEYTHLLKELLREIFNPDVPFDHLSDQKMCIYCSSLGAPSEFS